MENPATSDEGLRTKQIQMLERVREREDTIKDINIS